MEKMMVYKYECSDELIGSCTIIPVKIDIFELSNYKLVG